MDYAHKVFDQIPQPPKVFTWNEVLKGHAENGFPLKVLSLFREMKGLGVMPNCFTLPIVFKCCVKGGVSREGVRLHCVVVKSGFGQNGFVCTCLIELYCSGGLVSEGYRVFSEMVERNVFAWTYMISGYICHNDIVKARRLFNLAPEKDVVLWNKMVMGYIQVGDMVTARELFDQMPNKDVMSWNTVLNGYANNGDVEACERLFEEMPERNVFSWNGLIGGYAHNGCFDKVLSSFKSMLVDGNVVPNDATFVTVLTACSRLGALDLGKWVHVYAENNGYKGNVYVGNALIDMYSKCGVIDSALDVFECMEKKDLISWNSVIGGLAVHGRGADALRLFSRMKNIGEKPDGITFIGILCACMHMGLVEEGLLYFKSMIDEYTIEPQIEHYGCIVDLLARAGLLSQTMDIVANMPMEADAVIWAALLGACRVYKNIELAELALEKLTKFEPKNPANYVMLSNIYCDLGRWKDAARLKLAMRDTGFKKLPGCSLIEINDRIIEFYSLDERHPERDEIYATLKSLTKLLRLPRYVLDYSDLTA